MSQAQRQIESAERRQAALELQLGRAQAQREKTQDLAAQTRADQQISQVRESLQKTQELLETHRQALAEAEEKHAARFDLLFLCRSHPYVGSPDPYLFLRRPLGQPSGARIFAVTLERSPVPLRVQGESPWNVFPDGRSPSLSLWADTRTQVTPVGWSLFSAGLQPAPRSPPVLTGGTGPQRPSQAPSGGMASELFSSVISRTG